MYHTSPNNDPIIVLIRNLEEKKTAIDKPISKGIYFIPLFSLPLLINPSISEPSMEVTTSDTKAYIITKSRDMLTLPNDKGSAAETLV